MKTTMTKIALLGIAGAIAFALCSFKNSISTTTVDTKTAVDDEWAEWNKVQEFVQANITQPIMDKDKSPKTKMSSFSRCPSGYHSDILADAKDVKTNEEVFGSIVFYRGCSPQTICNYKVCVAKKTAFVKSENDKEYVTVKEWLAQKDNSPKGSLVKG